MVVDFQKVQKELKKLKGKGKSKSSLVKGLTKKLSSRRVLKKSESTMVIPEVKAESNFGNSSTFFKQEMEETRRGLFFS